MLSGKGFRIWKAPTLVELKLQSLKLYISGCGVWSFRDITWLPESDCRTWSIKVSCSGFYGFKSLGSESPGAGVQNLAGRKKAYASEFRDQGPGPKPQILLRIFLYHVADLWLQQSKSILGI